MNKDREKSILQIIAREKTVTVDSLAKRLYASVSSVRRDLSSLASQGLVQRVHGGAVLVENNNSLLKIPFVIRELEQSDAKLMIAKKAAELVHDGDFIMMDASSSAYGILPFLTGKRNLTVITSGIKTLSRAGEYGINAYSTGGKLIASCQSLTGEDALSTIDRYCPDILFFSCRGLSEDGFLTDFSLEENQIRKKMLTKAKKRVLLCDSRKFGQQYPGILCSLKDIDYLISDGDAPAFAKQFPDLTVL